MHASGVKQVVHRPGPLKQSNKPHKRAKSKGKKLDQGRVDVKSASQIKKHELNRQERKNKMNQLRKAKREVLRQKGRLHSLHFSPVLTTILSLNNSIDPTQFLNDLKSCEDDLTVYQNVLGHWQISCPRLKQRFTFVVPKKSDLHSIMDALKVSEVLVLLHSSELDEYSEMLVSLIVAHALPTTIHVIQGLENMNPKKKAEYRKQVLKHIETRFIDVKLQQADTKQDLQLLLRQIGNQKKRGVGFRDNRCHLLAEDAVFDPSDIAIGKGTLKVTGFVRGQCLNVNSLAHIPGWGTFQINQLDQRDEPHAPSRMMCAITEKADVNLQESLQSEVIPDPMEGEQTWPTQEELDEADLQPEKTYKRVVEGTSDYQAAWIIDSEDEESDSNDESCHESGMVSEGEAENEHLDEIMDDGESIAEMKDEMYDKNLDMDEEQKMLVRFKEEQSNQKFPDEEDTPVNISARIRYQRYRGLQNFNNSPWDPMENLPEDYARIYRFANFKHTKKKVLKNPKDGAEPGTYVTVHIKDVPQALYDSITDNPLLIIYILLPHEQKMSVVNTAIRKHASCKVPIKSKDMLIFHIGFTRFTCKPIFSEYKTGNKFKYERFLPSDTAVVASFFAPVIFPPASVVIFRQRQNGSHELVATGSVLDVNPNRIVVKRTVLSGHPFKILKRTAVIRYMFFNKEDINWFKCVELTTKCGRRGHIRESLGTLGHMKCVFDQQLPSQDVVLMSLYKRVFPKWTYDSYVPSPICDSPSIENNLELMTL